MASMVEGREVTIITTEAPSGRRDRADAVRRGVESSVSLVRLQESLERFVGVLGGLLEGGRTSTGEFELEQVDFSAEIGANGEFKLLGTGVGISGSSAVTFSWRRVRDGVAEPPG